MKLLEIQEKVVAALVGTPYFAERCVPVIAEDKGDVSKRLEAEIAETDRCILVQTPGFKVTSSASKVMVGMVSLVVQAIERIQDSREQDDGATAQDMAEVAAWELNMLAVEGSGVLVCRSISSAMLNDKTLSYAVAFDVEATLGDPLATERRR